MIRRVIGDGAALALFWMIVIETAKYLAVIA